MAEATHDKDNPFSFKSFMKRTSTDLTGHSEQLEKGGKNVKSTKKKKETRRKKNNDDVLFPEVEDPEKGMWNYKLKYTNSTDGLLSPEDADNPFSFTKFVKTKKTKKQSQVNTHTHIMLPYIGYISPAFIHSHPYTPHPYTHTHTGYSTSGRWLV